jgi:hypothetical protein
MELVEIVLNRGKTGWGKMMEGVKLITIYCKCIYKCHSVPPLYNYYMQIKKQQEGRARLEIGRIHHFDSKNEKNQITQKRLYSEDEREEEHQKP